MGDSYRTFKTSLRSWNGSVDVFFDESDTAGQGALAVGSEVTTSFQVAGDEAGDHLLSGAALVTGRTINSSFDGMVEASLTLQGTGELTESTVS